MKHLLVRTAAILASLTMVAAGCSINIKTGAVQDGGVFKSDNGGTVWTQIVDAGKNAKGKPVRIDGLNIQFIRFDPQKPSTMYLGTDLGGIYRSDNGGTSWVKTASPAPSYQAFAIDPRSTSTLYAAQGGTITKSTDGGAHWSTIYLESKPDRAFTVLLVNPTDSSKIYAASNKAEILLSKDYGNTWQLYSSLGITDQIRTMFFASTSSTTLIALTGLNGLYRSTTGGETWVSLKPNLVKFKGANSISSIATIPLKADTFYIGSGYGLLITNDQGTSWEPIQTLVPFGSQPIQFVVVNPASTNVLYVVVGNRLRKSIDGGKTWDAKIIIPSTRLISGLVMNPEAPDQLYIGTVKPKKK